MRNGFLIFTIVLILISIFTSCGGEKFDQSVKPNILLITIDTLRRDHLGCYGYPRNTSPFMDQLAKKGIMFKNAITPLPLTAGSHATILTSLHPLTHQVIMNGSSLNEKVQTMAEVLKEGGYYTIGAISVGLLTKQKKFSQGFDSFSDTWQKDQKLSRKFPLFERVAPSVNEALFQQINEYSANPGKNKKPLFIWVHYFDPHGPYYNHEDIHFSEELPAGKLKGVNKYDKEIHYTDQHIQKLYEFLQGKSIDHPLITCITADHGEQLGEHGYTYGHADFYSENTFVPLIFQGYGIPNNKMIDDYVSTMDISITLLGMAGLKYDQPCDGIDLFNRHQGIPRIYSYPNRKFLIIGNPMYARSLQLLDRQYSYILNFDYHYKNWYISEEPIDLKNKKNFKPLHPKAINQQKNSIVIKPPFSLKKGLNFAVLQADIKKNRGLSVNIKVLPYLFTGGNQVSRELKKLNIIFPVTVMDRLIITIKLGDGSVLENFKYGIISEKEFPLNNPKYQKINNKIYANLLTERKKKKQDELFDLTQDIKMENNLIKENQLKPLVIQSKKIIYTLFTFFHQKKNKLLKGINRNKSLSKEDKKMLKSLGYL